MDDLDLIRDFQNDFRGPDTDETARVRGAVRRSIADDRVRPATALKRRHVSRRLPRRRWLYAAAVAAAIVAAAVIIPQLTSDSPLGGVQSAAADALNKAASVAAGQQATAPPTAGQFVYTRTRAVWESSTYDVDKPNSQYSVLMPVTRESWIAPDGSGRLLETNGTPTFLTPHDKAVWEAAGRPDLQAGRTSDEKFGKGGLAYTDLSGLPTDTAQLRQLIVDRKVEDGPRGDAETFTIIGDLLRETWASPALRAALYRIAADLPGVQLVGTVKDEVGRTGTAVAFTSGGTRNELIFDPTTAALLGEESVVVDPAAAKMHVPADTVTSWAVYLASGIADSTSQRP